MKFLQSAKHSNHEHALDDRDHTVRELSSADLNAIAGGYKSVIRLDTDGDGKWDTKIVVKS